MQTIYAEDVAPYMSTFGFSLAGGTDLDGNTYPDMVVGAYESASSVVLRARPVVDLKVHKRQLSLTKLFFINLTCVYLCVRR